MLHLKSQTHPHLKNRPHWLHGQLVLRCVSAGKHHTAEHYILQNGQDKTPKASSKKQSIMKYLPGLPQDTKYLRSCSGNRAKMLSNVLLESNVTPNIWKSSNSFSTVPSIVNMVTGNALSIVGDLGTIRVLVLLAFYFIPQRSTH